MHHKFKELIPIENRSAHPFFFYRYKDKKMLYNTKMIW